MAETDNDCGWVSMTRAFLQKFLFLMLLVCQVFPVYAAEIRGQVRLQGMPGKLPKGIDSALVIVLMPSASTRRSKSTVRRLTIKGGKADQGLVVLQPGDSLAIVNQDRVLQPLLLFGRKFKREVGPAKVSRRGKAATRYIRFRRPGNWYLTSRLDNRIFTRIVVINAHSKIRTHLGEVFEFRNLRAGKWKLRIYSLLAADKTYNAEAYTSPQVHTWKISADRVLAPARSSIPVVNVNDLYRARNTR
jgi:hypothetical protein